MTGSGPCTLHQTCPVEDGYYSYLPSLAGNGVLLGCFITLIPFITFLGIRYRTPIYAVLLVTGIVFEVLCYIGRLLLHGDVAETSFFVLFLLGSTLGPTFITTAIFYILPRVMTVYDNELVKIRPKYFNYLFFSVGLLTLTLQAVGSVYAAVGTTEVEINQGLRILIGGLAVHVASLVLFFILYFWFLHKKSRRAGRLNPENAYLYETSKFRVFVFGWQLAAWFVFIRTVFRIVEIASGPSSPLAQTEAAFMVLDGAQVLVASVILTAMHPGKAFGKFWPEKSHQSDYERDFTTSRVNSNASENGNGNPRSYSPRRAPVPAELPLAYSNKYPRGGTSVSKSGYHVPREGSAQNSPANTSPGWSPGSGRYQDSPKFPSPKFSPSSFTSGGAPGNTTTITGGTMASPGAGSVAGGGTAKHSHRMSLKSAKSGKSGTGPGSSTSAAPKRSPREVQTKRNLVDHDDLW